MNHWHQGRTRRWLGCGLATVLTSLCIGLGSAAAQTPVELPLFGPRAKVKPAAGADIPTDNDDARLPASKEEAQGAKKTSVAKDDARSSLAMHDPQVKKASCCGGGLMGLGAGHGGSCANGQCVPGRGQCSWCNYETCWGRMIGGVYDCLCCPDQCYEPRWIDEANAAFFQDNVRPVTMTRIRWNAARDHTFADTAEKFWGKIGDKGPGAFDRGVRYDELMFYTEIAAKNFSVFVEIPYRSLDAMDNPDHSGFGDMNVGTKSLLVDCELIQMAFQFRTYIPVGPAGKGLGTGHVSLEPSLLTTIKLAEMTYLQTQLAEWIPIAGSADGAGSALCYSASLNHVLWHTNRQAMLIGTLEFNGVSFQDGTYTDANGNPQPASKKSFLSAGPGLRFVLCEKYDIGLGTAFGLTDHGPEQNYRLDFRVRF